MIILIYIVATILLLMLFAIMNIKPRKEISLKREIKTDTKKFQYKLASWEKIDHEFMLNLLLFRNKFKKTIEQKNIVMKLNEKKLNKVYTKTVFVSFAFSVLITTALILQKQYYLSFSLSLIVYAAFNLVALHQEKSEIKKYLRIMSNESTPVMMQYGIFYKTYKNPITVLRIIINDISDREISRQLEKLISYIEQANKDPKAAITDFKLTMKDSPGFEMLCDVITISIDKATNIEEKITEFCSNIAEIEVLEKRGKINSSIAMMSVILIIFCIIPAAILMGLPTIMIENDGMSIWEMLRGSFK